MKILFVIIKKINDYNLKYLCNLQKKMAKIYILYLQKRFNQIIKIVLILSHDMF